MNKWKNKLCYGDCLDVMKEHIEKESVNLIYLDPPFNSKRIYNAFFVESRNTMRWQRAGHGKINKGVQFEAFKDTWRWSEAVDDFHDVAGDVQLSKTMEGLREILGEGSNLAYLSYMANRLRECRNLLKPTGSIYLHCDPTMSHYLKIVMDAVFGSKNFLNEVAWCYKTGGASKRYFAKKHDIILFYKKGKTYTFNNTKEKSYQGIGYSTGNKNVQLFRDEDFDRLGPYTLVNMKDWWQIPMIATSNKTERTGYPTQKPLDLLKRIVESSSNEGDVVLDPFCGCGTAVTAAQHLGRRWIGIDVCHRAYKVIEDRLEYEFYSPEFELIGMPRTLESARDLAKRDKFKFETWAASIVDGIEANKKQRGDRGIDGRGRVAIGKGKFVDLVSQVKGGHTGPGDVQAFNGARQEAGADMGIFTCFEDKVTQRMRDVAASTGRFMGVPVIQIYTVDDWFNGKLPEFPRKNPA